MCKLTVLPALLAIDHMHAARTALQVDKLYVACTVLAKARPHDVCASTLLTCGLLSGQYMYVY